MSFNRKIFYVGGFDPRGVRFYHHMLVEQLARYQAKTGETVTTSPRKNLTPVRSAWTIRNDTRDVDTRYSFLRWEDVVKRAWIQNPVELFRRVVRTYRDHLRFLDFKAAQRLGKNTLITLFYPPVFAVVLPLLIALPIFLLGLILLPWWAALPIGLVAGVLLSRKPLNAMHVTWLLRFFVFNSELSGGEDNPDVMARVEAFADEIVAEIRNESSDDEILIMTHSNGSILAVPLINRIVAKLGHALPANFTLVTMGQCIPLVACRSDATRFHAEMRELATQDFRWIDIGSPPDGAAFFGVNPLLIHSETPRPEVELLSPRFHKFYDPDTYHKGWRNKYEIHFDYLRVGDRVSPLDFASLLTSDRTIQDSVAAFKAIP